MGLHQNKRTDVAEHPEVLSHVGLLVNEPPGQAELLFTSHPTTDLSRNRRSSRRLSASEPILQRGWAKANA